ncbi:MAG: response regulator [Elusimicrobiota bacterium]
MGHLLVIDNDESVLRVLNKFLTAQGFMVDTATRPPEVSGSYSLILLDIMISGHHVLETIRCLREKLPETPILLITGGADQKLIEEARALGAAGPVRKPFDFDELRGAIADLLGR